MIKYSIAIRSAQPGTKKAQIKETKAYGVAQVESVVTLNQLCEHISNHGSKYNKGDVMAVIVMLTSCMRELLLEGKKLQLGDLGEFHPTITSKGAKVASDFNASYIKKVNVAWRRGDDFANLIKDAEFQLVPSRLAQAKAVETAKSQETMVKEELS